MLVTASQEAGVLEEHEEQMLHRVFGFADLTAGQVMVPRTELVGIDADAPRDEPARAHRPQRLRAAAGLPPDLDDVVGIAPRDRRRASAGGRRPDVDAGALAREALTVPETLGADDLLAAIRRRRVARGASSSTNTAARRGSSRSNRSWSASSATLGGGPGGGERIAVQAGRIGGHRRPGARRRRERAVRACRSTRTIYTTVGGYVLGRLGRRARVGDTIDVEGRRCASSRWMG